MAKGYSIEMLNSIRNEASAAYQELIPEATRTNISQVGNAILNYELAYNEFQHSLIHKIGKTMIEQSLFNNKLARFKTGTLTSQQDVEEIYIPMHGGAENYDPNPSAGKVLERKEGPQDMVFYHRMNRQSVYDFTIGENDLRRAFRSEATLDAYITAKFNSVYTRANFDEYTLMKELLASYSAVPVPDSEYGETYNYYVDYNVDELTNEESARAFVRTVRKASMDMSIFGNHCCTLGMFKGMSMAPTGDIFTATPVENQVLFINKDVLAHVDVDVLAKSFNMGKTDFQPDIVTLDDFGSMDGTYGLLLDKDFFRVWDTYSSMKKQENGRGLFTNYFYHVWQILSLSRFKNAVRFTTKKTIAGVGE